MENQSNLENTLQLQAQPHFRSSVDHAANHTSDQRPVMRAVTESVTKHLVTTDKDSHDLIIGVSILTNQDA